MVAVSTTRSGLAQLRALVAIAGWFCACAARPAPAAPDGEVAAVPIEPTLRESTATQPPPEGEVDLDANDGLDADMSTLAEQTSANTGKPKPAQSAEPASRDIVYRVTPKGLLIELDGLHLRPEAKATKDKNGAYDIEIVVHAESFDGRQYWVKQPKEGPLSLAGKIEDKSGKATRFSDERKGDAEQVVLAGEPRHFRQRWPGKGQPKLWWGQTVTLEVGLWGVRTESERERPVRRLFVVKMLGGNSPQPVLTPPTLDWGS